MNRMKKVGVALAAATFVPLGSLAMPAPAQAAAAHLEMQCYSGGYRGSLRVYYNSTSTHDIFNRLNWYSSGLAQGPNNKVEIKIFKDLSWKPDQAVKTWKMKTRKGSGGRSVNVAVNRRDRIYVTFTFTFDKRKGTIDGSCYRRSRTI